MRKIWVNIANSYKQAEKFDKNYYKMMSRRERLETVQFLREAYLKMKKGVTNEGGKRLRRIIKIIQWE